MLALESEDRGGAATYLDEALAAADAMEDDLGRVAHNSVRAALHLSMGELPAAASLARRTEAAAHRRSNWIGVADAVITQSLDEPLDVAVRHIVSTNMPRPRAPRPLPTCSRRGWPNCGPPTAPNG